MSICIPFTNAGKISVLQSAEYALTAWANDCERKLLGRGLDHFGKLNRLNCGVVLPRERHAAWAARKIMHASIHLVEHENMEIRFVGTAS